jgi:hypothetical protein
MANSICLSVFRGSDQLVPRLLKIRQVGISILSKWLKNMCVSDFLVAVSLEFLKKLMGVKLSPDFSIEF